MICFILYSSCVFLCSDYNGTCIKVHDGTPKRFSCSRCDHPCFYAQNLPRFWECNGCCGLLHTMANVGEYIERIKNNKEAPCHFIQWHYDQPQILKKASIESHIGHHW